MKDINYDQIPSHIKRSVKKQIIIVLTILILSIIFRNNITAILIGTPISLIPIRHNTFLLLYFTLVLVTITLGIVVFYIVRKKQYRSIDDETNLRKFLFIFDITSFVLLTTILITFFLAFMFTVTTVSGDSMNDTFEDGDRVVVWHLHQRLRVDDAVVIFLEDQNMFILKRIKATANDVLRFEINNYQTIGKLYVNDNFKILISIFEWNNISNNQEITRSGEFTYKFTIPPNNFFVLGDNINNSIDSRTLGLVKRNNIIGTAVFRISPLSNMGIPRVNI